MAWVATDDFSSYTIGATINGLNGGSGWSAAYTFGTANITIQASPAGITPTQCARSTASSGRATRTFTGVTLGTARFYLRTDTGISSNNTSALRIENQAGSIVGYAGFDSAGAVSFNNGSGTQYVSILGSFVSNTWYAVDMDIDTTNQANKLRFRVNSGTWTAWTAGGNNFTSINGITINDDNTNSHNFYVADIKATPVAVTGGFLGIL